MTVREKEERMYEIERLNKSLKCWLRTPMLDSVKEIGADAIRRRLTEVARPLREEDR